MTETADKKLTMEQNSAATNYTTWYEHPFKYNIFCIILSCYVCHNVFISSAFQLGQSSVKAEKIMHHLNIKMRTTNEKFGETCPVMLFAVFTLDIKHT